MRLKVIISLLLAGITLAIYWPASHFALTYRDDQDFLLCPQVAAGFSPAGLDWVMKGVAAANWHPLTLLSFLMVHEFFGLNPGVEHLVNIFLHAANAALLFLVLIQMTGASWDPKSRVQSRARPLPRERGKLSEADQRTGTVAEPAADSGSKDSPTGTGKVFSCAIVAAVFAWHPLHVESVAWISERKDVLFTFFMLLSLWCYTLYAQAEQIPPSEQKARPLPEAAEKSNPNDSPSPLPSPAGGGRSMAPHAIPAVGFLSGHAYYNLAFLFFIFSLLSKAMVVTLPFLLLLLDYWPLQRLNRATGRSLLWEKARFFAAAALFCVITFRIQKHQGAVVAMQTMGVWARLENATLSYVHYLGKFFWPEKLAPIYPLPSGFAGTQVVLAALLLTAISAICLLQWRRRPYLAVGWLWYLGALVPVIGLVQLGSQAMADRYTYITLIGPTIALVWLVGEWVQNHAFWKYVTLSLTAALLMTCAVLTERQLQFWKDTVTLFEHTIAVTSDNGLAEYTLALGLEHEGLAGPAAVHYRIAIVTPPDNYHFMANFYLAELRAKAGFYNDAEAHLEAALQINPTATEAMNNLAWILATCPEAKARNGARAVQWAERACDLTQGRSAVYLTTLAAAYAEAGRFDDAIATTQKAIALANQYGQDALAEGNQELLQTYTAHQTYAQTHGQAN